MEVTAFRDFANKFRMGSFLHQVDVRYEMVPREVTIYLAGIALSLGRIAINNGLIPVF